MKKIFVKLLIVFLLFFGINGCKINIPNDNNNPIYEANNPKIDVDGFYNTRDEVALYIHTYGRLPKNYITKQELGNRRIQDLWTPENKMSVGGDRFYNREGLLPKKDGRIYYEADINYNGESSRGPERIVFSNDGLIFYTADHYETFVKYDPEDGQWKSF